MEPRWTDPGDRSETGIVEKVAPAPLQRQRRTVEEKRWIVEETLGEGASVARVARAHGVNANQVFGWRRLYRTGRLGGGGAVQLLPVIVSENAPPPIVSPCRDPAVFFAYRSNPQSLIKISLDSPQSLPDRLPGLVSRQQLTEFIAQYHLLKRQFAQRVQDGKKSIQLSGPRPHWPPREHLHQGLKCTVAQASMLSIDQSFCTIPLPPCWNAQVCNESST